MLLCIIVRTTLSASLSAAVQIVLFLLPSSNIWRIHASLPPGAEDEIILIEHLPGRRVHLQDFFWTGADDAPPWVEPGQGLTYYETRTVHRTVTVYPPDKGEGEGEGKGEGGGDGDQNNLPQGPGVYVPGCTSCIEPTPTLNEADENDIGILIGEDPGPRYWLLTVLRAGEAVPPKIELRLARLYKTAFTRQQQRHLGLLSIDPRTRRLARARSFFTEKVASLERVSANAAEALTRESISRARPKFLADAEVKATGLMEALKFNGTPPHPVFDAQGSNDEETAKASNINQRVNQEPSSVESAWRNTTNTSRPQNLLADETYANTTGLDGEDSRANPESNEMDYETWKNWNDTRWPPPPPPPSSLANEERNFTAWTSLQLRSDKSMQQGLVQVRMQNTSVIEGGATRLIYSVHLGGKPVPAETAARDMALLSEQEVALELGAPVIVQSEPYLKETRPLALSRKRDVWLLVGAAGAAIVILAFIVTGVVIMAKRKRAHSAVVAPPSKSILKKDREHDSTATAGVDNAGFSTSETEKSDATSQRHTSATLSRTPATPGSQRSLEAGLNEVSSDNDEDPKRIWDLQERVARKARTAATTTRITRTNAMDQPRTPDSLDSAAERIETLDSIENGYVRQEDGTTSPHSYLSMPSCKQFPSMRTVEPLSRVLEPVMVRHLDIDSPELPRHANGQISGYRDGNTDERFLARASSASKDPGVLGPIVWNLRRQKQIEGTPEVGAESAAPAGPVGRARRRLHELLEDSFSLFGSRDPKTKELQFTASTGSYAPNTFASVPDIRGRSTYVSPTATPTSEIKSRPRTSVPRRGFQDQIAETGNESPTHPRGAWGSRPLSAGPFHRPNLPEVDVRRVLVDSQLPPEDPAVPLIASIKKELEKFAP